MTTQLNAEVAEGLARRIKADAKLHGVTLNAYATVVHETFLSKSKGQRAVYFEKIRKKILGRRLE